ncbi:HlyD family secretion protein [Sphingobium indicum IP26]|uniref:Membrane fusion protein (MFP) family protein n=1 Tax=Sphingobium indicum F2 TaxID=1450518 RepID=A0A8E0WS01_9SPHN|nr:MULTISPECIES: HlyD family type I secretion periplasmic adaptor subunit [Sphingobium]EPR14159.1 HlyD family secretion protein [Sphingobium indicum IP26]EPR18368.1 HlyD family secretion protein [Sphingobium indicum IP26]EQB03644.1 HlyD family secretion protein [Sphingobium sp. HDIP04]KER36329.1 secretion protein HlyD [Sphingobium indicum F2]
MTANIHASIDPQKESRWLRLIGGLRIIPLVSAGVIAFFIWSYFGVLDEVAVGPGKVTPPSRSQVIQSLEGGIVNGIFVHEGDIVKPRQQLATLDRARFSSMLGEAEAKARALEAAAARLEAEINGGMPRFSADVQALPALVAREMQLLRSRRENLEVATASLRQSLALTRRQLAMTEPLVDLGAANRVEIIQLQRQENELQAKLDSLRNQYVIDANAEYAKTRSELDVIDQVIGGRRDQLNRTRLISPVRGIVKNLEVTTIGGVIQPGGSLMEIVPLEDELLVEARISPRDIAFIRPGQPATVKITAYDPSIYGTLDGTVDRISPDTLQDEVNREQVYYRVYVRTRHSSLRTKDGREHAIMPGMVANVEIRTGRKTVLQYLLKPINKAKEAMRER